MTIAGTESAAPGGTAHLANYATNAYSQFGEDGIIAEILARLATHHPPTGWCVEFGAWDGVYLSNTARLIREEGYRAVLIEGDPHRFGQLCDNYPQETVTKVRRWIGLQGAVTLADVLADSELPNDFDVLSIDIDGCDYHVWASLGPSTFRPRVVCIEHNGSIPNSVDFVQPPDFAVRWGASAAAICRLGRELGYRPAAVTEANVLLVREDLADEVIPAELSNLPQLRDDSGAVNHVFCGYDGTVLTERPVRLYWHRYPVPSGSLQALPRFLRHFPGSMGPARKAALATYLAVRSPEQSDRSYLRQAHRWLVSRSWRCSKQNAR